MQNLYGGHTAICRESPYRPMVRLLLHAREGRLPHRIREFTDKHARASQPLRARDGHLILTRFGEHRDKEPPRLRMEVFDGSGKEAAAAV